MNQNEIIPSRVNIVTEHKENYKLVSLTLMDSYNGLHPSLISKLAHVIFNLIIYNKMYRNPDNKNYSLEEDRRIYSNVLITPETILKRMLPSKYQLDNKDISNDISNLTSRIQMMEDMNIFYVWRYKQPYTYLFILERDVGCWKYYNTKAVITPKTLKKIVRSGRCIMDTMAKLEEKRGRNPDIADIENSFGSFITRMISKMHSSVTSDLSKWVETANINDYLARLSSELRATEEYKGQEFSIDFLDRLPETVRKEIANKKSKEEKGNQTMNVAELEMDLVPKNENLTKVKRTRKTKTSSDAVVIESQKFTIVDPFNNSMDLVKYYRSVIRSQDGNVRFYNPVSETPHAQLVLDALIKHSRNGDKKFLKMWILNFVSTSLKGNNMYKEEKTSMKTLLETFSTFNGSYYG